ncbi:MAG: helix-turn-helix transcriptional regulator [Bacteroidetes bacterium]|nr:helix-turn-helix transcriptional regulator [Bacteroidota bacterium]
MQQASFDNWTIIFLNFSFIGFLLFFFFWLKRSYNKTANRLVAIYVLLYAVMMVEYVLYWTHYLFYFPGWTDVSASFPLALGPLLYLYFKSVYEKKKLQVIDLLHFIPLLIFLGLKVPFYLMPGINKLQGPYPFVFKGYWKLMSLMPWIKIAHNFIYALIMILYIKRQTSVAEIKKWAYSLIVFFILFVGGSIAYYTLVLFPWFNVEWDYFISFIMSAAILCTAWFAFAYPSIFSGFSLKESVIDLKNANAAWEQLYYTYKLNIKGNNVQQKAIPVNYSYKQTITVETPGVSTLQKIAEEETFTKYKNSGLTDAAGKELLLALQNMMETEKLYRENDINLESLAKKLDTTKHNLSQVINERIGLSFFEYINILRIEEAMQLLKNSNKKQLTIIEVAYDVGFNNKVTFNTAFKKHSGKTPTEFRNSKQNE